MSVQFGRWNHDGRPVDAGYLQKVEAFISTCGPDASGSYAKDGMAILYRAFCTTEESRRENQPCTSPAGAVITWDGRLDNRAEFVSSLGQRVTADATDVEIVAAAFDTWDTDCFSHLLGDWALSVWNPGRRSLILARDPIGLRHLYYYCDGRAVTWSTILAPLVRLAEKSFPLDEEYIAGWLAFFPATHLTPYRGIHAVPPSSFALLRPGSCEIRKYWDFDPERRTRYATDAQYEEHFRSAFAEAVRRRLRADTPVLAELSGGMDSSSIVCMADRIMAGGAVESPRLDTVSYFDDSEPNWNERPYFTAVEAQRGRAGMHIDAASVRILSLSSAGIRFAATPESLAGPPGELVLGMAAQGNRVLLSGVGGDEMTGGVPTPNPELEDLLARLELRKLARQLKLWALNKRRPWFHLLFDAARGFFPPAMVPAPRYRRPAAWLNPAFVRRNRCALEGYEMRLRLFGPRPTFQENLSTLEGLRRQLSCSVLDSEALCERRYPYLDRSLLEFLFSIPREQLVRPGQRRSLMRRALAGIVPELILNRKRKAYIVRSPLAAISSDWNALAGLAQHLLSASLGIVDQRLFLEALQAARQGQEVPIVNISRALHIESWLRNVSAHAVLTGNGESSLNLRERLCAGSGLS